MPDGRAIVSGAGDSGAETAAADAGEPAEPVRATNAEAAAVVSTALREGEGR
jgi:hypothetical protein